MISVVLEVWITEALNRDDWEVISETEPYSSSVVDTFSMFFELMEYLSNFAFLETKSDGTRAQIFAIPLAMTLQTCLIFYFSEIFKRGVAKVEKMQQKGHGGWQKRKATLHEVKQMADRLARMKRYFSLKRKEALKGLKSRIPGKEASLRKKEKISVLNNRGNKAQKNPEEVEEREFNDDVYVLCIITNDLETCRMVCSFFHYLSFFSFLFFLFFLPFLHF